MIAASIFVLAAIASPPVPTHYVTDTANALSATAQAQIETQLRDFKSKTGDQVIVWIGQTTGGEPLEQWTVNAAERWRAGRKGKDNGAVLFVFMQDHKIRIEVGYGLEDKLTDAESARIISGAVTPAMRKGDVDGAVQSGVDGMLNAIDPVAAAEVAPSEAPSSAVDDPADQAGKTVFAVIAVAFVLFIVILSLVRRGKKHGDFLDSFMVSTDSGNVDGGGGTNFGGWGGGGGGGFSGGGGGFGGGGASGGW